MEMPSQKKNDLAFPFFMDRHGENEEHREYVDAIFKKRVAQNSVREFHCT